MKRRKFLRVMAIAPFVVSVLDACKKKRMIAGKITGASATIGHMLRNKPHHKNNQETLRKKLVIIGAGISGLSAARELKKNKVEDFLVLELENQPGGNSSYASNEISAFPQGAHYVPIPNNDLVEYIDFLEENNVITGMDANGLPVYNEMYLCFDSQERLFLNGNWQEGVVPRRGLQPAELKEIDRFFSKMQEYRGLRGTDGRYAFDIPVDNSSKDENLLALDKITMKQWLDANGFKNPYLFWYVNYCSRDDFGTPADKVSAWAGIHYFASRKGRAANAESGDILTWPEGNGFLMNKLADTCRAEIRTNALTTSIKQAGKKLVIEFIETGSGGVINIEADQVIIACPQYVSGRLLHDEERIQKARANFFYTPWLVANIKTKLPPDSAHIELSWDNVFYKSDSLGYVNATHQMPAQVAGTKNLTYYLPFTAGTVKDERKKVAEYTHQQFCEIIIADMEMAHPGIRSLVEEVTVTMWGHSMAQPLPGFISGEARRELSASIGSTIHFAHTDIAGISIFEEAFYQGINAAKKVLANL